MKQSVLTEQEIVDALLEVGAVQQSLEKDLKIGRAIERITIDALASRQAGRLEILSTASNSTETIVAVDADQLREHIASKEAAITALQGALLSAMSECDAFERSYREAMQSLREVVAERDALQGKVDALMMDPDKVTLDELDALREHLRPLSGEEVEAISKTLRRSAKFIDSASPAPAAEPVPIDMLLYCPSCGMQHIDEPDHPYYAGKTTAEGFTPRWDNPPHRSHLCHDCGCIWRPADVATNGVAELKTKGKADTWKRGVATIAAAPSPQPAPAAEPAWPDEPAATYWLHEDDTIDFNASEEAKLLARDVQDIGIGIELYSAPQVRKMLAKTTTSSHDKRRDLPAGTFFLDWDRCSCGDSAVAITGWHAKHGEISQVGRVICSGCNSDLPVRISVAEADSIPSPVKAVPTLAEVAKACGTKPLHIMQWSESAGLGNITLNQQFPLLDAFAKLWPAVAAVEDARDAARYRWLQTNARADVRILGVGKREGDPLSVVIDAAMAAAPAAGGEQ